ncbi:hypothetical protein [Streptomyces tsukubensis]|nr:hypothetical protein [Streptomyces tsukubensis]
MSGSSEYPPGYLKGEPLEAGRTESGTVTVPLVPRRPVATKNVKVLSG